MNDPYSPPADPLPSREDLRRRVRRDLDRGKDPDECIDWIVKKGSDRSAAEKLVQEVDDELQRELQQRRTGQSRSPEDRSDDPSLRYVGAFLGFLFGVLALIAAPFVRKSHLRTGLLVGAGVQVSLVILRLALALS